MIQILSAIWKIWKTIFLKPNSRINNFVLNKHFTFFPFVAFYKDWKSLFPEKGGSELSGVDLTSAN